MAPGVCSRCGGPNPHIASTCQWCGGSLAVAAPPSGYQPILLPATYRRRSGSPGAVIGGVILIVFGLLALVAAAVVNDGVTSFNQACSQNPACQGNQQSNPSGGIAAVGIVILIVGGGLIAYGVRRDEPSAS